MTRRKHSHCMRRTWDRILLGTMFEITPKFSDDARRLRAVYFQHISAKDLKD